MPPLEIATEADHAAALAAALESADETTLDPTDCRLAANTLRHYAALLDNVTP
ncbi:hypothetical protein BJ122_11147 [Rhodopseudomonas faecalis]|uniref:Uncharacterized protein n=1 Tax=Rhodopseudomonas faecalis TaxID=99655 RepID=A0A318THI2_9BRAD|nr:hypothetical protein [Rhodopseudomonas faecalis]PYF02548.1 hypothetical protein BJ122_11147 [Rhodopseudomonas faecalis]